MRARQRMAVPAFGAQRFQPGTHAVFPAAALPVGSATGSGLTGMHMMGGALPGLTLIPLVVQGGQRTGRSAGGRAPNPRRHRLGAGGGGQGQAGRSSQKMLAGQISHGMIGAAQQQQQMATPGVAGAPEPYRLCVRENRNPNHSYLQCVFAVCSCCKQ